MKSITMAAVTASLVASVAASLVPAVSHANPGDQTVLISGVDAELVTYHCGDIACGLSIRNLAHYSGFNRKLDGDMKSTIANARLNGLAIDVIATERNWLNPSISIQARPLTPEERDNKIRELMTRILLLEGRSN